MVKRLLTSILLCGLAATASAGCRDIPVKFFGLGPGPVAADFDKKLAWGIWPEGRAEIIRDVGFVILKGSNNSIDWRSVMVFFGRDQFDGLIAHGVMGGEKDGGFDKFIASAAEVSGTPAKIVAGKASFTCDDGLETTIEPVQTQGGPQFKLVVRDPVVAGANRKYVDEYCSDPARIRPQDACKKN